MCPRWNHGYRLDMETAMNFLREWVQEMFAKEDWYIFMIGFLAQLLFSTRLLLQWLISEKNRQVKSPAVYWILSLIAAALLSLYGWYRQDFSIILGQLITYYIYVWNLYEKNIWQHWHFLVRWMLVALPVVVFLMALGDAEAFFSSLFRNPEVSTGLLIFGSLGQVVFTLRFIYQLIYSYRRHESILPVGFWWLSLLGSSTIMAYGLYRSDPVLILGQSCGWLIYIRNIWLWYAYRKRLKKS